MREYRLRTRLLWAASLPFVILDPGHGGKDLGTKVGSLVEKNLALQVAKLTAAELKQQKIASTLLRTKDETLELDQRVQRVNQLAVRHPGSVLVSIHVNSGSDTAQGIETFILNTTTNETSAQLAKLENGETERARKFSINHGMLDLILTDLAASANQRDAKELACEVHTTAISAIRKTGKPTHDRGVNQALFYVLLGSKVPGILFETGFASNTEERRNLLNPKYQKQLAQALAHGINSYFRSKSDCLAKHPKL